MRKLLSILLLLLLCSNIAWALEVTDPPEISCEVLYEEVIVAAEGEGEVYFYINGEIEESPCAIARGDEGVVVVSAATAQGEGKAISEMVEKEIVIPAYVEPANPHESGCWLVMLDRYGRDIWHDISFTTFEGDHIDWGFTFNSWVFPHYADYGGYNPETDVQYLAPFYIVIDGVRYGAEFPYMPALGGENKEFPLIENDNYYFLMPVGGAYETGVAEDVETGEKFLIVRTLMGIWDDDEHPEWYITGDVDRNYKVNIDDVTTMINYLLSGNTSNCNVGNADVNRSGRINIDDVTALINYLLSGSWW